MVSNIFLIKQIFIIIKIEHIIVSLAFTFL